ncbi:MAG: acyltransferase family protein [Candidatus Gastranaerophilales bacterium]|nr:acyltransferase family protein [Candidatus Gastranaerophilales bacterium]
MDKLKKRIDYIDLLKSFGIIVMVLGHVFDRLSPNNMVHVYIYAFHMPLFFFISGFLYKSCDLWTFIKRKFNSLILPYLFFGLLNGLASFVLVDNFHLNTYFERIFFFNHKYIGVACAIWFLTALFFVNVIYILLEKFCNKYKYGKIVLPIIIFALGLCSAHLQIKLPYSISSSLSVLPIFYVGTIFKQYREKIDIKGLIIPVLCLILPLFTIALNGKISTRQNNVGDYYILFILNSLLTIFGYWFIFEKIQFNKWLQKFKYIGVNSLYYMCLNQIVIYVFIFKLHIQSIAIVFILTMIILYFCTELLKLIPAYWNKKQS